MRRNLQGFITSGKGNFRFGRGSKGAVFINQAG